ncbi:MAG: OmpA family protein [Candidatus Kapabacteria bacterium]|jgi:outer membrane protein OmpA-like peptidoglycan-associated protein|nr:OmpA family protein [Candidatus Kapabacteria bacterium]
MKSRFWSLFFFRKKFLQKSLHYSAAHIIPVVTPFGVKGTDKNVYATEVRFEARFEARINAIRSVLCTATAVFALFLCCTSESLAQIPADKKPTRSDTANILISGKRESIVTTRPKRELPGYQWLLGFYGTGALQQHTGNFGYLAGMTPTVAADSSFGAASALAGGLGAVVDYRLSSAFQVQMRLGASISAPEFFLKERLGFAGADYDTIFAAHRLRTSLINLHFAPSLGFRVLEQLFLNIGAEATYTLVSQYSYTDSLFPAYAGPYKDRSYPQSGSIQPSLALSAFAGLDWFIPISRNTFLTPFVRYHFPLTSIAETRFGGRTLLRFSDTLRTPISQGSWTFGSLQAGVSFQWGEGSTNPVIRETVYERDTSSVIVEGGQERLRLRSTESGLVTSEENGLVVERTVIHESYIREVPKQVALKADVRVTGIDWDGKRQQSPTVIVEEFETETYHPLLPHIFFQNGGADLLQTRQTLLTTTKAADAWKEATLPNGALNVHANMLNVIGARMKANQQARLTVTGCVSDVGAEKDNTELAMRRAKAVQTYLATIWRIKADRIRVQARTLPEKASSSEVEEGIAENRRVELSASEPTILAPVVNRSITRSVNPPSLELQPLIDAPAGLRSWTMAVKRNNSTLQQWTGESVTGEAPPPQQWRLSEQLLGESEIPLKATIQATDLEGRESTKEQSITVRQVTVKKKRVEQVQDKRLERFSLMLFDFDRAEISAENLPLLGFIKQRIQPSSQVTVIGYGDRVGSREYNRDLAFRRSSEVKNFLQLPDDRIKIIPIGSDILLHDNSTPEGRSYCRIVQILVATPMEK